MNDTFFHAVLVAVFLAFTAIRAYYYRKATRQMGNVAYKEGRRLQVLRALFGIPTIIALLTYIVQPNALAWAKLALPEWTQWVGVALGLASLPLIWWVQWALDVNFSVVLHVRDEHTLVTHGPYRWVRHPMYTVLYVWIVSLFLLSQNAVIGAGFLVPLTVILITRLKNEEAAMIEKFGEEYRQYMAQTGRFLPRLGV